jgi:hypothetical protein
MVEERVRKMVREILREFIEEQVLSEDDLFYPEDTKLEDVPKEDRTEEISALDGNAVKEEEVIDEALVDFILSGTVLQSNIFSDSANLKTLEQNWASMRRTGNVAPYDYGHLDTGKSENPHEMTANAAIQAVRG